MAASCPCPLQTTSAEKAFNTLPQDKPQLLRGTAGRRGRAPAADTHVEVYVHGAVTVATFWNPGSFLPAPRPPRTEPPCLLWCLLARARWLSRPGQLHKVQTWDCGLGGAHGPHTPGLLRLVPVLQNFHLTHPLLWAPKAPATLCGLGELWAHAAHGVPRARATVWHLSTCAWSPVESATAGPGGLGWLAHVV